MGHVEEIPISSRTAPEPTSLEFGCTASPFGDIIEPLRFSEAAAFNGLPLDDQLIAFGLAPLPDEEAWWKRFSPSTILGLTACAVSLLFLIYELLIAKRPGYPYDGAWVYMVYARNFFHDIAFSFNPGEHTTGPTSPFWTIFTAVGYRIFHDPIIAGKLLGSIFNFLTGYYAFRLLRALEIDYPSSLAVGILCITAMHTAWAALSGGDSALAAAIVMGGFWWHFAYARGKRRYLVGAIFALATIARPETSVVFGLLLLHQWIRSGTGNWMLKKRIALQVLTYIVILVPVATTNYTLSGSIFPQTFHSVIGTNSLSQLIFHGEISAILLRLATSAVGVYNAILGIYIVESPLLFALIIWAMLLKATSSRQPSAERLDRFFSLGVTILLLLPYIDSLILGSNGDFGEHGRWVTFLSPIYFVTAFAALRYLVRYFHQRPYSTKTLLFAFIGASVLSAAVVLSFQDAIYFPMNHFWDLRLLGASDQVSEGWGSAAIIYSIGLIVFCTIAIKYCRVGFKQVDTKERLVKPSDENRLKLEMQEGADEDSEDALPLTSLKLQRSMLLLLIGWNLALLPKAATEFANEVAVTNTYFLAAGNWVQDHTDPQSVVVTNGIGTVGWASGRTIEDTEGRLPKQKEADILVWFGAKDSLPLGKSLFSITSKQHPAWPSATVIRLK